MGWSIFSSGSELFRDHEDLFTPYPMLYWSSSRLWRLFYPLPHAELVFIQDMKTYFHITPCRIGLHPSYEDLFTPCPIPYWSSSQSWRPFSPLPHAELVFIHFTKTFPPQFTNKKSLHHINWWRLIKPLIRTDLLRWSLLFSHKLLDLVLID